MPTDTAVDQAERWFLATLISCVFGVTLSGRPRCSADGKTRRLSNVRP
jgi:hypothetical protein